MTTLMTEYAALVADGSLDHDAAQEAVLPELERIRLALNKPVKRGLFRKAPKAPMGLYLWGGVGRGKSMLIDFFVSHLSVTNRRVHFHAFMQEIHAGMHDARQCGVDDAIAPVAAEIASSVRLLAFDEMQITDITDAMIVGRLFEALFAAGVVVVTTSNRAPDDLYKDGLNRQLFLPFIDMLNARMVVWELTSPNDYRQSKLTGSPTYFSPLGPDVRTQMDAIWEHLSGGTAEQLELIVNSRKVIVPEFRNGVGRASFFDLCAKPLGPADYLAIAESCRVLIIDDIPTLSRNNFNEAKRFVVLIDALYEAKVRLVCSAAAAPEMLYLEGEGTFEFERTASRLREMQSSQWASEVPAS